MSKDFYKTLGVDKSASEDELKKAYRRLAHQYHPDKQGGSEDKFKEINEAYQVLSDKQKRAQYDQFGSGAFDGSAPGGAGGFGGFGGGPGGFNVNFEDLGEMFGGFGDFFGGGRQRGPARGDDIAVDVTLTFAESIRGLERVIRLRKGESCDTCSGSGAEPGSTVVTCKTCAGSGQITQVQRTILGAMQTRATCTDCHGSGRIPEKKCHTCRGTGVERKETEITVKIPGGVNNGDTMRFTGKGEASTQHGAAGDLYVRIHVERDERITRDGMDLHVTHFLPFSSLVNGTTAQIQIVDDEVKLKIPDATQSGTTFRVRGKGVAGRGDLFVRVEVNVPKRVSRKARKLLEELERELES